MTMPSITFWKRNDDPKTKKKKKKSNNNEKKKRNWEQRQQQRYETAMTTRTTSSIEEINETFVLSPSLGEKCLVIPPRSFTTTTTTTTTTQQQQQQQQQLESKAEYYTNRRNSSSSGSSGSSSSFILYGGNGDASYSFFASSSSRGFRVTADTIQKNLVRRRSSQDLNLQFEQKVQATRQKSDILRINAKLEEESITLNKLHLVSSSDNTNTTNTQYLVGRDFELQQLESTFHQFITKDDANETVSSSSSSCVISISGTSGTGKTALAKQLKPLVLQAEGYFCLGKFDMMTNNSNCTKKGKKNEKQTQQQQQQLQQPYAAFASISIDLAEQIIKRQEAFEADIIRERIEIAIGDDGIQLLLSVFPGLSDFLLPPQESTSSAASAPHVNCTTTTTNCSSSLDKHGRLASLQQKTNQLHYTIRQLFRILSTKESPLVLVLDDIQWADRPSLNLVEALLMDREIYFMLVVTYRSDEISDKHPYLEKLQSLQEQQSTTKQQHVNSSSSSSSSIQVVNISIGNLSETATNSLVANALRESEENTKSLSTTLYQKTNGNAFFLVQYLQMLVNDGLLTYNLGLLKWTWQEYNDDHSQELSVSDNVGSLLSRRIQQFSGSSSTQKVLQVAACLGQSFEEEILMVALVALVKKDIFQLCILEDLPECLHQCIDAGLLKCSLGTRRYTFVHDLIQSTAYELIPQEDLPKMQLEIGRSLLFHQYQKEASSCFGSSSKGDKYALLFLAVDLCNKGSALLDSEGKLGLAVENCRAANYAIEKFAFETALAYGKIGIQYLDDRPQRQEQRQLVVDDDDDSDDQIKKLRLQLHVALAEASFCMSDAVDSEKYAEMIIGSDFSFDQKFNGYVARMLSQFAQRKVADALETTLFILRELGCVRSLDVNPGSLRVRLEVKKTKQLCKSYSKEDLINLPLMTDKNRLRAMATIFRSDTVLHSANPNLFVVLLLMAVRWTIKYGVSNYTPPMFAFYGLYLTGALEDFDRGIMIGEVALALSERLQATQTIAATTSTVFSFVFHWKKHVRSARSALEFASHTGLRAGDVNHSISTLMMLDHNSYMCGYQNLKDLSQSFREHVAKIREFGNEAFLVEHCIAWQSILNLQGNVDDPFVLSGEAIDQKEAMENARKTNHTRVIFAINVWSGLLGYLYDNHEFAVCQMSQVKYKDCLGYVMMPRMFAILALSHVALALDGKQPRQNLKKARSIKNKMLKKWMAPGNINIAHLVRLLDAELTSFHNPDAAVAMYEEVVRMATRAGFRNDTGAIHARAARFFFAVRQDTFWASYHLERALAAYGEWGATGVAKNLQKKYMDTAVGQLYAIYREKRKFDHMIEINSMTTGTISTSGFDGNTYLVHLGEVK